MGKPCKRLSESNSQVQPDISRLVLENSTESTTELPKAILVV